MDILLVDDDPLIRLLTRELVSLASSEVILTEASSPAEAKRLIASQGFHGLITDLDLKATEDGGDVLFHFVHHSPGLPAMLHTSDPEGDRAKEVIGLAKALNGDLSILSKDASNEEKIAGFREFFKKC